MADPVMKIVVDVVNSEKIKELTKEIETQKDRIAHWNKEMKEGHTTLDHFNTLAGQSATKIHAANGALKELQASSGGAGRGLSQLAYAVDDIQYGFNAIVNNIPQIVMGLGGGAGIAGALGILAVAINQVVKHWDEWTAALASNWSEYPKERLLELKKHAEQAGVAFEKAAASLNKWEQKGAKGAEEAIIKEGPQKVRDMLAQELMKEIPLGEIAPAGGGMAMGPGGMGARRTEETARQERLDEARKRAAGMLGGATLGDEADRAKLQGLINSGKFKPSDQFRMEFAQSDPAAVKAAEEHAKKIKAQEEVEKKIKTAVDAKNKAMLDYHDKEAALTREQRLEEKRHRMEALEDKREIIHKGARDAERAIDDKLFEMRYKPQILQGARAGIDLYQTAGDARHALEKEKRDIQANMLKALDSIDVEIKKERRLVVPK